ncbi:YbgA family protein [Vagococcus hydrophili]|uniref:YbgA family protein n=1 Tax=Vagococcus hydrophili TaxID=2714947 RepID=A0A6G8AQS8_9ENTE|nr:YbgA family protein [Vagococcus hydrophili]QIL47340.1 YbgA family protein [Vagococcus hydrophili]
MKQTLEKEWAYQKYFIMSHSQKEYLYIRQLFSTNNDDLEKKFNESILRAEQTPPTKGSLTNAYQHVWGYFKKSATSEEKEKFQALLNSLPLDEKDIQRFCQKLSIQYDKKYLLQSRILFPK